MMWIPSAIKTAGTMMRSYFSMASPTGFRCGILMLTKFRRRVSTAKIRIMRPIPNGRSVPFPPPGRLYSALSAFSFQPIAFLRTPMKSA